MRAHRTVSVRASEAARGRRAGPVQQGQGAAAAAAAAESSRRASLAVVLRRFSSHVGAPSPSRAATAAWEPRLNRGHGESVLSMTLKGSHDSNPPLPSPPPLAPAAPRCHPRYRRPRCSLAARPQLSSRSPASRQAAAHQPLASRSPAVVSLSVSLCSFSLSHLSLGSGTPRRRFGRRRRRRLGRRCRLRLRLGLCSRSGAGSGSGPGPKPLFDWLRPAVSTCV